MQNKGIPSFPDHFLLGRIVRTHGVKGDLILILDVDDPSRYQKKLKTLLLANEDELETFDVVSMRQHGTPDSSIIHLKNVDDMNSATALLKRFAFLPVTALPKLKGNQFYFHEIPGFQIVDKVHGALGLVSEVYELPAYAVIGMMYDGKEVLIPAVPEILLNLDRKRKIIETAIPDGLLEVYLGNPFTGSGGKKDING